MSKTSAALPLLAALALARAAAAQGSDLCANAMTIVGTGLFPFDTTSATTDGSPNMLCYSAGQTQIERDVWFKWVAPLAGFYEIATCGLTGIDSRVAVYSGSCSGAMIACNDDACGLQSETGFPTIAGQTYLFRIGVYPGQPGGTGSFQLRQVLPPAVLYTAVNPTNNHTYHVLDASTWKEGEGAARALGGHLVTIDDQIENDWVLLNLSGAGGSGTLWIGFSDELVEGTWIWSSAAPAGFTNWDTGQPDNWNNEDYAVMRPNGRWNDVFDNGGGVTTFPVVEIDCAPPSSYCTAGTTTNGCVPPISASGVPSATAPSGFTLTVASVEGQKQGVIFYGISGRVALPWSSTSTSFMCVKSPVQRTVVTGSGGTTGQCDGQLALDWNAYRAANPGALGNPFSTGQLIQAQGWFRDPLASKTTNLSDALEFSLCQ